MDKPILSQNITSLDLCNYSKSYVHWRSDKISSVHADSDEAAITGEELSDILRISDFLYDLFNKRYSIIETVDFLYKLASFSPDTQGRAGNVLNCVFCN